MDDAPDMFQADGLATVVASIDGLLQALGQGRDIIDFDKISHETGISVDRVHELLDGVDADLESDLNENFRQRLVFLRETRRKPDGKRYTLDDIGRGAGISHGQVGFLLKGQRMPGLAGVAKLEKFFAVQPGFFTATDRQALHRALQPIREQLIHLALLKGQGINRLAMRSGEADSDSRLGQELRAALTVALGKPDSEDQELRELADEMRSLPSKSRRRIFPQVRKLLGLARPEGDELAGQCSSHVS
ncbi:helix-turn-helix transcriptional regulator [Streptomyces syringium]|uniref:helix-turn-helix transcriptional regulator n=1 Tax=Streptomyces syringium TaxID=76729 RepID=UPI0033FC151D